MKLLGVWLILAVTLICAITVSLPYLAKWLVLKAHTTPATLTTSTKRENNLGRRSRKRKNRQKNMVRCKYCPATYTWQQYLDNGMKCVNDSCPTHGGSKDNQKMIVNTKRLNPEDVTDDDNSYEIEAPEIISTYIVPRPKHVGTHHPTSRNLLITSR